MIRILETCQESLLISREVGNSRGEAIALNDLGSIWFELGDHLQARRYLEDALRLTRAIGAHESESSRLIGLSAMALREADCSLAKAYAQSALDIAAAVQNPVNEAFALCQIGYAEFALGLFSSAVAAFERCRAIAAAIGHPIQHNAAAGLAQLALAQDDIARAMREIAPVLAHLDEGGSLHGTDQPRLIELICYQVFARASDPRAAAMLDFAYNALQATAATISDMALRQSYLNNIP